MDSLLTRVEVLPPLHEPRPDRERGQHPPWVLHWLVQPQPLHVREVGLAVEHEQEVGGHVLLANLVVEEGRWKREGQCMVTGYQVGDKWRFGYGSLSIKRKQPFNVFELI